ncbi:TPA: SIR2 family protein [Legionella pneumophila]|uniref:SIR2 family protein n=1 Tax=Legionella pneumophila TaxID=446 RepID=UPI0004838379|nr:SIR2 family protein [Legionella pneumophila]MDW8957632.1 SIR2 family protein [Legionella pneumophila]MDW9008833.1 SIR2 family protein [Legionella pneumophila]STX69184.1 Uncharacterised protein [Legionella pneumophila]HAT1803907.1 hypothetical protein [Legionella pneumophila]HAT1826912.1 hypothetical protein [Legionella pneumophila]
MELSNIDDFKHLLQSSRLNFLIGSGLSSPYLQTLGDIETRLDELEAMNDCTAKELARASIIKVYFESCISKNYDLCHTQPIEAEEVIRNYKSILHNINKIILLRRSNLLTKQVNLFTTNVDIFLEKSLEEQYLEFNDGFSGTLTPRFALSNFKKSLYKTSSHYDNKSEIPMFNLYKLHGSLTWKLGAADSITLDSQLNTVKSVRDVLAALPDGSLKGAIKNNDGRLELKTIEELISEYQDKEIDENLREILSNLKNNYDRIPMINPTKEKFKFTTLNYTYYELLRMFSNELERENSVLFVMGFSFADEHIREIVLRAINSNPTLIVYIFPYDQKAKEQIKEYLSFQNSYPKNNNLKFVFDETSKNDLASINKKYFNQLADSLINKGYIKSTPKETDGKK